MNIPKAIEILEEDTKIDIRQGVIQHLDATRLGIEALKRVRYYRPDMGGNDPEPLPGETKD